MLHEYSLFNQGTHQVSEHFKVKEFAQKDYRCDKILIESELVKVLEDVRTHFNMPVIITSGYRSPEYNIKAKQSGITAQRGLPGSFTCLAYV